jgi:hypothetical protein
MEIAQPGDQLPKQGRPIGVFNLRDGGQQPILGRLGNKAEVTPAMPYL